MPGSGKRRSDTPRIRRFAAVPELPVRATPNGGARRLRVRVTVQTTLGPEFLRPSW